MNERIKELAYKAGFGNVVSMPHIKGFERFANLLQRDMIEDCRDMFCVGSVSWNLLNEKLEIFGDEE